MREILNSVNLPKPKFRYNALIKAGPFYQTAGMIGVDLESGDLVSGGTYQEAKQILQNLVRALPDFNLSLNNLVSARVYASKFGEFALINQAWEEVFTAEVEPPTRTSIGVEALPLGAAVEMEFQLFCE